ncbi:MAG: hypothetical protein ACK4S4_09310 [Pyrinomonadaceae bacterium]
MKKPHDSYTCERNLIERAPRVRPRSLGQAVFALIAAAVLTGFASAQSTSIEFPTPITTSEIAGSIRARDIGDPRTTSYYFTFDAAQGDLFVNVATKNLNGNIDLFTADGLRLLTRMVMFADVEDGETGRVVYFRKPERVILRIEGRTPNDDPATFRIKFAGSFVASSQPAPQEPKLPEVKTDNDSGIRVNSVGTIIERRPRPTPTPTETASSNTPGPTAPPRRDRASETTTSGERPTSAPAEAPPPSSTTPNAAVRPPRSPARANPPRRSSSPPVGAPPAEKSETRAENTRSESPSKAKEKDVPADPLADVRLVVVFKDGRRVERPMTEVLRFTVDHGSLTIVSKDGRIYRFPIAEVARVTVE